MKHLVYCLFLTFITVTHAQAQEAPENELPPVNFLSTELAAKAMIDDSDEPFFARLFPREAAAMTATPRGDKSIEDSQLAARVIFHNSVLEFKPDEIAAIRGVVESLVNQFGDEYPLLIRRPWTFIKTKRDLCGGFSFTRGECIVLSESTLRGIVELTKKPTAKMAEKLLLHEQIHVLERIKPDLFLPLFRDIFLIKPATVVVHPWIDERQVTNPDGISDDWIVEKTVDEKTDRFWIGTILAEDKPLHVMGRDFSSIAIKVTQNEAGKYEMAVDEEGLPDYVESRDVPNLSSRLPVRSGYDHPNEVAAYLFTIITHGQDGVPLSKEANRVLQDSTRWFQTNLKPAPEEESEITAPKEKTNESQD